MFSVELMVNGILYLSPNIKMYVFRSFSSCVNVSCQSLTKFESLASQVQKNAGDIQERLNVIENVRLFKQPPAKPGADLVDAKVQLIATL